MEKYFSINESGYSIRCKLYANSTSGIDHIVLFGHGFGGHKDNKAAARFAGKMIGKHKTSGVITFDWPCHGEDALKSLSLSACDFYIKSVVNYIRTELGVDRIYVYATSFGGYLFLKYIQENENPFSGLALRCPAVKMYDVITSVIMTEDDHRLIQKGKPIMAGFDRKVKIGKDFLEDIKSHDITALDYSELSEYILILQGTKDEVVSPASVEEFSNKNSILYIPIENADHRFMNQVNMDEAIKDIIDFFELNS